MHSTKSPVYLAAVRRLREGLDIDIRTAAVLLGLTEKTMRKYGAEGRWGSHMKDGKRLFSPTHIRIQMGELPSEE